ncbi:MAG TPA: ATP-binding protein, partial [Candidatus Glassbacteria bacterium]|nr:ATP-binding protein [Candidatus Glassbacteria bacterium]
DSEQLFRALLNLAINAVEAAGAGGKVTISAGITENEGGGLEIKVMDSGPGIAAADLDKVFQPFFTSKKNGTGLGLSNVKKIAEAHGGSISAGNGKNGGAVFTLRLPGGEKLA